MKYGRSKLKSIANAKSGRGTHNRHNRYNDNVHGPSRIKTRTEIQRALKDSDADLDFGSEREIKARAQESMYHRGGKTGMARWAENVTKNVRDEDRYSKVKSMLSQAGVTQDKIINWLWRIRPDCYPTRTWSPYVKKNLVNYHDILENIIKTGAHAEFNLYLANKGNAYLCRCDVRYDAKKCEYIYPKGYPFRKPNKRKLLGLHDIDAFVKYVVDSERHHGSNLEWDPNHNAYLRSNVDDFIAAWAKHHGNIAAIRQELHY